VSDHATDVNAVNANHDQFNWLRLGLLICLVIGATAMRLIPHPMNFAPIGAMALFAGATFRSRWLSVLVPVAALGLSDLILGVHSTMTVVYGCFLLNVALGWWADNRKVWRVASATLLGSVIFFLATNFAFWWSYHEHTFAQLMMAYANALPFFRNSLAGDAFYVVALFGLLSLFENWVPAVRPRETAVAA